LHPKGSLKSKMERRRLAANGLQTAYGGFAQISASRQRAIVRRFGKGFRLPQHSGLFARTRVAPRTTLV
jgi:hypothetical protein